MKKVLCVYSGGMDSTVLLHHCIKEYDEISAITFNYNQRHNKELDYATEYFQLLKTVNYKLKEHIFLNLDLNLKSSSITNTEMELPTMSEIIGHPQPSSYVPNRNMTMLSVAAGIAEAYQIQNIVYGAVAVDNFSYWDCTQEFLDGINNILHLNRMNNITVHAPILMKSKKDIIIYGQSLGVDFAKTWTCYAGKDKACGVCPSCSSRIAGFKQAKIIDPINYAIDINW